LLKRGADPALGDKNGLLGVLAREKREPVPPFEGVKDGLVYHLSNLSMEGFKVKKENIMVEIAHRRQRLPTVLR
jgi:hypothetical protein